MSSSAAMRYLMRRQVLAASGGKETFGGFCLRFKPIKAEKHASNERRDEGLPSAHLPDRAVEKARCTHYPQQPIANEHFAKCLEDCVFRWLLGSNGVTLELPGVYRIRHQAKGRYAKTSFWSTWRKNIRVFQSGIRGD